jgi:hypothetical protein
MSEPTTPKPSDDDDERTTIVERADAAPLTEDDERTTVVERVTALEADDERTRLVERAGSLELDDERTTLVERAGSLEPDDERTTVVERANALELDDERTTVVERANALELDDERTIIASRRADSPAHGDDDHSATIIVARAHETAERPPATSASRPSTSAGSSGKRSTAGGRRGRRRITLPPVEPGFGADPVDAVGPGAIATYVPRTIAPVPTTVPAVPLGADATRAPAPSMPSVGKRSRTIGIVAVGGFALACVVSVVGLVTIVVSILP